MLPPRRLFRSRWVALLWAGGVIWTAVDVAGSAPAPSASHTAAGPVDAMGDEANAADLAAIANVIGE